jgi:hypothetical protein
MIIDDTGVPSNMGKLQSFEISSVKAKIKRFLHKF